MSWNVPAAIMNKAIPMILWNNKNSKYFTAPCRISFCCSAMYKHLLLSKISLYYAWLFVSTGLPVFTFKKNFRVKQYHAGNRPYINRERAPQQCKWINIGFTNHIGKHQDKPAFCYARRSGCEGKIHRERDDSYSLINKNRGNTVAHKVCQQ